jgi:hypothetical protein
MQIYCLKMHAAERENERKIELRVHAFAASSRRSRQATQTMTVAASKRNIVIGNQGGLR